METRFNNIEIDKIIEVIYGNNQNVDIHKSISIRYIKIDNELKKIVNNIEKDDGLTRFINDLPMVKFVDFFDKNILLQSKKRFIIVKLTLVDSYLTFSDNFKYNDVSYHSNILIIDNFTKEIERFDPVIQVNYNPAIDIMIIKYLIEIYPNYNYITPIKICPLLGPQDIEESFYYRENYGHCAAWCIYYLNCRINDPNKNRKSIINKLISQDASILHNSIIKFALYLRLLTDQI